MNKFEEQAKNELVCQILAQVDVGKLIEDAIRSQAEDFVMTHLDFIYDAVADEISDTVEELFDNAISDAISEVAESII